MKPASRDFTNRYIASVVPLRQFVGAPMTTLSAPTIFATDIDKPCRGRTSTGW
jgi:hypothetical protein